jgi:hypothetical protein
MGATVALAAYGIYLPLLAPGGRGHRRKMKRGRLLPGTPPVLG